MASVIRAICFVLVVVIFLGKFGGSSHVICTFVDPPNFWSTFQNGACSEIHLTNGTFVISYSDPPPDSLVLIKGVQANVSALDSSRDGSYESIFQCSISGDFPCFSSPFPGESSFQINGVKFVSFESKFSGRRPIEIVNSIFEESSIDITTFNTFSFKNCSFSSTPIKSDTQHDDYLNFILSFETSFFQNFNVTPNNFKPHQLWIKDSEIRFDDSSSLTVDPISTALKIENSIIKGGKIVFESSPTASFSITSTYFFGTTVNIAKSNSLSLIGNNFFDQALSAETPNVLTFNSTTSLIVNNLFRNISSTSPTDTSAIRVVGTKDFVIESNIVQLGRSIGSGRFSAISVGTAQDYLILHNCFFNNEAGLSSGAQVINVTDNFWGNDEIGSDKFLASQVFPILPEPLYSPVWPSQQAPENCTPALNISLSDDRLQNNTSSLTIMWSCSLPDEVFSQISSNSVILELIAANTSEICFSHPIASISNGNCSKTSHETPSQNSWTWTQAQTFGHSQGNDFRIRVRFGGEFSFVSDTSKNITISISSGDSDVGPSCPQREDPSSDDSSSAYYSSSQISSSEFSPDESSSHQISSPQISSSPHYSSSTSRGESSSLSSSGGSPTVDSSSSTVSSSSHESIGSSSHSSDVSSNPQSSLKSSSTPVISTHSKGSHSSSQRSSEISKSSAHSSDSQPSSEIPSQTTPATSSGSGNTHSSSDQNSDSAKLSTQSSSSSQQQDSTEENAGGMPIVLAASAVTVIFVLALLICGVVIVVVIVAVLFVVRSKQSGAKPPDDQGHEMLETSTSEQPIKIQVQALEIPMSKLVIQGKSIGRGAFGEVFKARYQGSIVAFKRLDPSLNTEDVVSDFKKEAVILAQLQHANIIQLYGVCTTESALGIITEFMEKGSLDKLLRNEKLGWLKKVCMLRDIASGMLYLHSREFLHRDMKPQNILVNQFYVAKISDFGTSKLREHATSHMTQVMGTPLYMAPEVFSSNYSFPIDIYSFGCICYELLTEKEPYYEVSNKLFIERRVRDDPNFRPTLTEEIAQMVDDPNRNKECKAVSSLVHLMQECWKADPRHRPLTTTVLERIERILSEMTL